MSVIEKSRGPGKNLKDSVIDEQQCGSENK